MGESGAVIMGLEGLTIDSAERELLRDPRVGGVILFARNVESRAQVADLTAEIRSCRPSLLIAVDQEGGRVQRLRDGFSRLPPPAVLGRLHATVPEEAGAFAEACGWLMADELLAVGFDLSLAPVLDLGRGTSRVIGDRAFSADPEVVSALAGRYIQGMRRAGMAATGKHFPGHGTATADSHTALPVDGRPFSAIWDEDLVPFRELVTAGSLGGVMMAHIVYPETDRVPAGFSPRWIDSVLRQRLGFEGAVMSDDLNMVAAEAAGGMGDRTRAALGAGCDLVLVCRGLDEAAAAVEAAADWQQPAASVARRARLAARPRPLTVSALQARPEWQRAASAVARLGALAAGGHEGPEGG